MPRLFLLLSLVLSAGLLVPSTWAASKEKAPAIAVGPQYVYLQPGFTVNFGSMGRLRYLRTEIAVKVSSAEAAAKVNANMPYLRSDMIMLLSNLESEDVNTPQGREHMRKQALDKLRGRLTELTDEPCIEELYFSNFVVQN